MSERHAPRSINATAMEAKAIDLEVRMREIRKILDDATYDADVITLSDAIARSIEIIDGGYL